MLPPASVPFVPLVTVPPLSFPRHQNMAASKSLAEIELGFVEETDNWRLKSKYFPSKVGGKPAWLNLKDLPDTASLECPRCGKPRVFLLQVYAPETGKPCAFHRTIFVFVCKNPSCNKRNDSQNFCVFRCQLPRVNEFYSAEPPVEKEDDSSIPSAENFCSLCVVCGCLGEKKCGRCHRRPYCSRVHQSIDWKAEHKYQCTAESISESNYISDNINTFLLAEYELVIEAEEWVEVKDEKTEEEKLEEYRRFLQSSHSSTLLNQCDQNTKDLEEMAMKNDKVFNKFCKRVNSNPEQVLRYQRGGEPLWVSSEHVPQQGDIPKCQCGAERHFEFQIMPQLLNYLNFDQLGSSVDWGTLLIYTCSQSCDAGQPYKPEIIWKQDFSNPEDC